MSRVLALLLLAMPAWAGERPSLEDGYGGMIFRPMSAKRSKSSVASASAMWSICALIALKTVVYRMPGWSNSRLHFSGQLQGDLPKGRYWFVHPDSGRFRLFVEPRVDQRDFATVAVDMLLLKPE